MAGTWNKRDRENKKQQARKQKEEKKLQRKENAQKGKSLEDMMAYVDENGNIVATPPDPAKRTVINVEDIEIGVPKQRELDPEELLRTGVITFFNHEKGFGFIRDARTQESIFVHVKSSPDELKENQKVSFEVERGPKGLNAVNVRVQR